VSGREGLFVLDLITREKVKNPNGRTVSQHK